MQKLAFNSGDDVSVGGRQGIWTIVGLRDAEPHFQVQLGANAASQEWVKTEALTLVQSVKAPNDDGPRLIPSRGIMD